MSMLICPNDDNGNCTIKGIPCDFKEYFNKMEEESLKAGRHSPLYDVRICRDYTPERRYK